MIGEKASKKIYYPINSLTVENNPHIASCQF